MFQPPVGTSVDVSLHVGHLNRYTPYVRNPAHIRGFVAAFDDTLVSVPGSPGRDPAGSLVFERPGLAVLGYRSRTGSTELPAARFEAYLREEGLEYVIALRGHQGESQRPGRELFSRCAKALVQVGGSGGVGYDRRLGFMLELVPERSPYGLLPGDTLAVRLLFRDRPLKDAQVAAVHASAPTSPLLLRTDTDGRVHLPLAREGMWLVKSVHMVPAAGESPADWESFWASLTFELPRPST